MKRELAALDELRGLLVLYMIFYHLAYHFNFTAGLAFWAGSSFWKWGPWTIGGGFALLLGYSISFAFDAAASRGDQPPVRKFLKRGAQLFGLGMVVTLVSFLFESRYTVFFGILHFLGAATWLAIPVLKLRTWMIVILAFVMGILAWMLHGIPTDSRVMAILGLDPIRVRAWDYWPILPWFVYVIVGIAIVRLTPAKALLDAKLGLVSPVIRVLGRRSLLIYVIHLPIIAGIALAARNWI